MKSKTLGILVLVIVGVVFISGCAKQEIREVGKEAIEEKEEVLIPFKFVEGDKESWQVQSSEMGKYVLSPSWFRFEYLSEGPYLRCRQFGSLEDAKSNVDLLGEAVIDYIGVSQDGYSFIFTRETIDIKTALASLPPKGHAIYKYEATKAKPEAKEEAPPVVEEKLEKEGVEEKPPEEAETQPKTISEETIEETPEEGKKLPSVWTREGMVIPGGYCDAEVVKLSDGRYRMYYGLDPRIYPENINIVSAVSSDGLNWISEPGTRISEGKPAMPSVIELPDGGWRMYYSSGGIYSAISDDGLNFQAEGLRLADYGGLKARSTTIIRLDDGRYRMYYCEDKQQPTWPVRIKSAISSDGLSWEIELGIRIDGSKLPFYGHLDGPDIIKLPDGSFRLYLWSGSPEQEAEGTGGVYMADSADGLNFPNITFVSGKFTDEEERDMIPCDPSLIKIEDGWRMYYGSDKGISSATIANLLP